MALKAINAAYGDIEKGLLPGLVAQKKRAGARFVQMCGTLSGEGVDVTYSFLEGDVLENWTVRNVAEGESLPSITSDFIAAFVFENELHDLFGVSVEGIAIDFGGKFYALAEEAPMTYVSPELKAAREKAAKVRAAMEAKAKKEAAKAAEGKAGE